MLTMQRVDFSNSYDVQQTCLNGHVITNYASDEARTQFACDICGAKTITVCPDCKGPIRGGHKYSPVQPVGPDAYCLHCGKPFPWTRSRFDALREIAAECDELSVRDREQLSELLPDLIAKTETPRTQLAIVQIKKLVTKGGKVFAAAVRKVVVDVGSESVKKILFP